MKEEKEELYHEVEKAIHTAIAKTAEIESWTRSRNLNDEYLDLSEASRFTKLAKQTLYGYVSKRRVPFQKIGSKLIFCKKDLVQWLDSKKVNVLPINFTRI
jgi:predicted DNA-binding transcriptional regulator AlpA